MSSAANFAGTDVATDATTAGLQTEAEVAAIALKPTEVRRSAMDFLARREHGLQELCDKLVRRFGPSPLIRSEVERLRDEGLQSDRRFVEAYVHSRAQRLYGPARIRLELRERRIAETLIEQVLAESAIDWSILVRELMWRKFGRKPPETITERAKRQRFLAYRGFNQFRLAGDDASDNGPDSLID